MNWIGYYTEYTDNTSYINSVTLFSVLITTDKKKRREVLCFHRPYNKRSKKNCV